MGMIIAFYAANADRIAEEMTKSSKFCGRLDWNSENVSASVDFSLHITPLDFDVLSEAVAQTVGSSPIFLLDSLARILAGNVDEECTAVMDRRWVNLYAMANEEQADEITALWIRSWEVEYGVTVSDTSYAVEAVRGLIWLCRLALDQKLDVILFWCL